MPQVIIDGLSFYYASGLPQGKEPRQTVLFVHGAGGSHRHWLYQLNDLQDEYMVLAVDLPGHGRSQGKSASSIASYREFIRSFAEKLIGHPFFLAGHSMGGAITLDFARCYPEMLAGMILIGTGARLKVLPSILESFAKGEYYSDFIKFAYGPHAPASLLESAYREMYEVPPSVYYDDLCACNGFDLMKELSGINVPALVISADQDMLTPVKYGRYLQENLPRAEHEVISGAGHMIMLEKPEEVNRAIRHFLEQRTKAMGGMQE